MRLAYSSNAYLNYSIEETIARIAGLGYQGLETAGRRAARLAGRTARPAETGNPRLPRSSWAGHRECQRVHDERRGRSAAALLAPVVDRARPTLSGPSAANTPSEPCGWPRNSGPRRSRPSRADRSPRASRGTPAANVFYDEIMPCVALAEELEVFLLIEPEPGLMIERFEQYLEFAGRIGSPWVGLNFDIGHAYCMGEEPQRWIARMAPHTKHYHLEDIAATRKHAHLVPGRGAIDFPAVLTRNCRYGLSGLDHGRAISVYRRSRRGGGRSKTIPRTSDRVGSKGWTPNDR